MDYHLLDDAPPEDLPAVAEHELDGLRSRIEALIAEHPDWEWVQVTRLRTALAGHIRMYGSRENVTELKRAEDA
jgi:hypothetical protein